MPSKPASLKVRALKWLAQREHSRDELKSKLLRLVGRADDDAPDPEPEIESLLDWLVANGYLSQSRFIESRVHTRQQRYGNLRIAHELQRHGVAVDPQTQATLELSEFDRAREVWAKKFDAAPADAAARVRQIRFLSGRGFSSDVIRRVLREAAVRDSDSAGTVASAPDPSS